MGLFDGKVAIVTGSGGGIGRAHALAFAREGAAVVVNDLGSARDGTGETARMADAVVEEIRAAGGRAAASYDSVASFEGARNLVKTALDAFGRLDILVNNAGILRDKSLLKMEEPHFDAVLAVHLKGTWNCTRHAAEAMVAGGRGGRIVNTTSIAGLRGNFGQSNYGAAKAGIWGLTLTCAIEMKKHGITVNAIAPMAKTRLTEDIDVVPDEMKPEQVSPVVLWLASEQAGDVTGRCFGVHPPRIFEYRMVSTDGAEKAGGLWTVEEVQRALPEIERIAGPAAPVPQRADYAPAARDLAAIVDRLVKAAPRFFLKERAAAMRSVFHLHVKGAKAYTIRIEGGECAVLDGHEGTATCNVKTDAETYVGMAEGKVNPQKAFMEQKLTADNLGEAMKYATAFRQPRKEEIRELIGEAAPAAAPPAAAAAAAPASPKEAVDQVFARMGEAFVPAKAAGWKAAILWKVAGAGDYVVEVAGGKCATRPLDGAPADWKPTCTVKLAAETLIGMVTGKVNPQKAFMEGKITADNLADMMRFGGAFDLRAPARAAGVAGARDGSGAGAAARAATPAVGAPPATGAAGPVAPAPPIEEEVPGERTLVTREPAPGEGLNRAYVGRKFSGGAQFARPDHVKLYALATNDPNPHYLGEKEPWVAPPLFVVRLFKESLFRPLTDPGLNADLLRLVHGEEDLRFHRPIRPWDLVTTRSLIHSIEDKSSGQILRVLCLAYVEGRLAVEGTASLFIRGPKGAGAGGGPAGRKEEEKPAGGDTDTDVAFRQEMEATPDQSVRYAGASLDDNPIHMDPEVAKMAGLPGVILQGLCTMAFTSRAVVQEVLKGDPRRLKRLSVRFSKPVLPGDRITTVGRRMGAGQEEGGVRRFRFESVNQRGEAVITNGIAEVSP